MDRVIKFLSSPGARRDISNVATTQLVGSTAHDVVSDANATKPRSVASPDTAEISTNRKAHLLDRCLDRVVAASGSGPVFVFILCGLLTWALLGIKFANSPSGTDWQVSISDIQALVGYVFDSLLMRQQLNDYEVRLRVSASLRSRAISMKRMFRQLTLNSGGEARKITLDRFKQLHRSTPFAAELPGESFVGHVCTWSSFILGHIITIALFWAAIIVWLAFGQHCGWSVTWQLYINSATSAFMVLMFGFLANIRERHGRYTAACLSYINTVDTATELRLRELTGDEFVNETVTITAPQVNKLQRAIFYYADVVGTLFGIALLVLVIVIWISIGPAMHFNSSWWLIIGTYAGLVGMHDGFILQNVQQKFDNHIDEAFEQVHLEDLDILSLILASEITKDQDQNCDIEKSTTSLHLSDNTATDVHKTSPHNLTHRISSRISILTAHPNTIILDLILIIILLISATAMEWSETGQLLCNIPPSIIESFVMMVLITSHHAADSERRVGLREMYVTRLGLFAVVEEWSCNDGRGVIDTNGVVSGESHGTVTKVGNDTIKVVEINQDGKREQSHNRDAIIEVNEEGRT